MKDMLLSRRSALMSTGGALIAGLGLTACSSTSTPAGSAAPSTSYKIGVLQLTEHAALDSANKGFIAALDASGISYTADQQNAQNDLSACQTIAAKLVSDNDDLIFAIATPAAQAVAATTTEIPIVGTAITDFAESGLVKNNEKPNTNVTGTSDLTPVAEQLELLHKVLPNARKVGILYCSAEANSSVQVRLAEEELDRLGLEAKQYSVASSVEIQSMVETAVSEVDALYAPTDNTISSSMAQVAQIALDAKIPVICGEEAQVTAGGLFSLSINYEELGRRAGEMAVEILTKGTKPATMPIETMKASELKIVVNEKTAAALGVDVSGLTA
ncbi:ABC transporter substrate-binding protein [Collinsella sp. zg1085]|uniref:ABC transporter substrate-binding protein n=1 Tax=Collinsella sp. zg1085 TaxID=2844380 RepID=UPI001C0BF8BF|nr:ABC transporter substrate-binding protein [Collinsella sp. zg1085]QWT17893.1 ABC transporter substrate-binding protein [Collinsella sp. zg1085]